MKRTKSSKAWLQEHVNDAYVQQARAAGYRSRAAYKLMEIDDRYRLIRPGMNVVELGAAPGSWSQVVLARLGRQGRLAGIDLLPVEPLAGAVFVQGDFTEADGLARLEAAVGAGGIDLVLSDMAPNISGVAASDQARAMHLGELALTFALERLKPGGGLLVKTFQGRGFDELRAAMAQAFEQVIVRKPKASRDRSAEVYLLGLKRRTAAAG